MPTKKPKKPAKRARSLVSADQRRRQPLRKKAEGRKKPKPQPRPNRPVPEAAATEAPPPPDTAPVWWGSSRAIGLAITGVVTAAILIAAGLPGGTPGDDRGVPRPGATPQLETESAAPAPDPPIAPATTLSAASKTSSTERSTSETPVVEGVKPSMPAAAASESTTSGKDETIVTLTGCLDLDKQTFRLKDASGPAAPKTRSWRSGFRKRASTIDLVDPGNTLSLRTHVGERVTATGTLDDRELRAHSLRVVSYSCR